MIVFVRDPGPKRQEWANRRRPKIAKIKARIFRRRRHRNRFGGQTLIHNRFNPNQKPAENRRAEIDLPSTLDLEENYESTITHMRNVRRAANGRFRLRLLNFEAITRISPSAALILASEVDRWNRSVTKRLRAVHDRWDPRIRTLLCEMGFFELLQKDRPPDLVSTKNTTFLPFISSTIEDRKTGGQLAKKLRVKIEETAGQEVRKHLFFEGLSEAITNVSQHAYGAGEKFKMWWMFAAYSVDKNLVTVSFYDHGRTIPGTLPSSKWFEQFRGAIMGLSDAAKIKAALELGRSATSQRHRGKGLQNFLEIIRAHPGGEIRIYSGHGMLIGKNSSAGISEALDISIRNNETPLRGTLVEWRFSP